MNRKDTVILRKVLRYCIECGEACSMFNNDFERFCTESVFQNACCMCILQIGELCKTLSSDVRKEHPEVSWKGWCGIRDVFAHQYTNLDFDMAWDAVQIDLPVLRKAVEEILSKEEI